MASIRLSAFKRFPVLAMAYGRCLPGCGAQSGEREVVAEPIERRDIKRVVASTGAIAPPISVEVGSQLSGQVATVAADFIRAFNETERAPGRLLASAGLLTHLVGGIGIMNVMPVSVTERTREIGQRLAVGARPADIRNQFLIEAVTLCAVGRAIGLALGAAGALAVERLGPSMGAGELEVAVNWSAALVAMGASGLVGVSFGLYPAHRASRLDPIEALRHE